MSKEHFNPFDTSRIHPDVDEETAGQHLSSESMSFVTMMHQADLDVGNMQFSTLLETPTPTPPTVSMGTTTTTTTTSNSQQETKQPDSFTSPSSSNVHHNRNRPQNSNSTNISTSNSNSDDGDDNENYEQSVMDYLRQINMFQGGTLSKTAVSLQIGYDKLILACTIPKLEDTHDQLTFLNWLSEFDKLLKGVALNALTCVPKNEQVPDLVTLQRHNRNYRNKNPFNVMYDGIKHVLMKGHKLTVNKTHKIHELNVVYLATLDTFSGLEEKVYDKLKASVSRVFSHAFPIDFEEGALRSAYLKIIQEFRRPNNQELHKLRSDFLNGKRYSMKSNGDPRLVADTIARDAAVINETANEQYLTTRDCELVFRNVIEEDAYEPYKLVLRSYDRTGTPSFTMIRKMVGDEYRNYVRSGESKITKAYHAKDSGVNDDTDSEDFDVLQSMETACYVHVPKGHCIQYAIRGKCTRDKCEYQHVKGKPSKDDQSNRYHQKDKNSGSKGFNHSNGRSGKFGNRPKHTRPNVRNPFEETKANMSEALEDVQDDDTSVSSEEGLSDSDIASFVSAFKAKFYKKPKSKANRKSAKMKHPNTKPFVAKMNDIVAQNEKKQKEERRKQSDEKKKKFDEKKLMLAYAMLSEITDDESE